MVGERDFSFLPWLMLMIDWLIKDGAFLGLEENDAGNAVL